MPTMQDIEAKARIYAAAREQLSELVLALNTGLEELKRNNLPAIRRALNKAAQHQSELKALVESSPSLFERPKTRVMHGSRVGFIKGKGRIEIADPEKVIRLIRKHLPDQADVLISVKEEPAKAALAQLSAHDLKAIGCAVTGTDDVVVVAPVDSEVDKIVLALLKGALEEAATAS